MLLFAPSSGSGRPQQPAGAASPHWILISKSEGTSLNSMPEIWPIYMSAAVILVPFRHRSEDDIFIQKMHPSKAENKPRNTMFGSRTWKMGSRAKVEKTQAGRLLLGAGWLGATHGPRLQGVMRWHNTAGRPCAKSQRRACDALSEAGFCDAMIQVTQVDLKGRAEPAVRQQFRAISCGNGLSGSSSHGYRNMTSPNLQVIFSTL